MKGDSLTSLLTRPNLYIGNIILLLFPMFPIVYYKDFPYLF